MRNPSLVLAALHNACCLHACRRKADRASYRHVAGGPAGQACISELLATVKDALGSVEQQRRNPLIALGWLTRGLAMRGHERTQECLETVRCASMQLETKPSLPEGTGHVFLATDITKSRFLTMPSPVCIARQLCGLGVVRYVCAYNVICFASVRTGCCRSCTYLLGRPAPMRRPRSSASAKLTTRRSSPVRLLAAQVQDVTLAELVYCSVRLWTRVAWGFCRLRDRMHAVRHRCAS